MNITWKVKKNYIPALRRHQSWLYQRHVMPPHLLVATFFLILLFFLLESFEIGFSNSWFSILYSVQFSGKRWEKKPGKSFLFYSVVKNVKRGSFYIITMQNLLGSISDFSRSTLKAQTTRITTRTGKVYEGCFCCWILRVYFIRYFFKKIKSKKHLTVAWNKSSSSRVLGHSS